MSNDNKFDKIAFYTQSPELPTGFGNVMRTLSVLLPDIVNKREDNKNTIVYNTYPSMGLPRIAYDYFIINGASDQEFLSSSIERERPELLVAFESLFRPDITNNLSFLKKNKPLLPILGYYPLDRESLIEQDYNIPFILDGLLMTSEFAEEIMYNNVVSRLDDPKAFWLDHAYHPVNENIFKPSEPIKIKSLENSTYIIGIVQMTKDPLRKNLINEIHAVAQIIEETRGDVGVYLHGLSRSENLDIMKILDQYNPEIKKFFILPPVDRYAIGYTQEEMARLYSTFDLTLMTTGGEGFGLPTVESMMCGVPVLGSNNTATQEIIKGFNRDWLVNSSNKHYFNEYGYFTYPGTDDIKRGVYRMIDYYDKKAIGDKIREYAVKKFGMDTAGKTLVNKITDFYDWWENDMCFKMPGTVSEFIEKKRKEILK